jgi:hypothetical protein
MALGKKPSLAIAIGVGKPKPDAGGDGSGPDDEGMSDAGASLDAAQALIEALDKKDAQGVDDALRTHYALCESEEQSEMPEEPSAEGMGR